MFLLLLFFVRFQLHAEYDTLHAAGVHTACHNCGRPLLEVEDGEDGEFLYKPRATLHVSKHFCSQGCDEHFQQIIGTGSAANSVRNSSNLFPLNRPDTTLPYFEYEVEQGEKLVKMQTSEGSSAAESKIVSTGRVQAGSVLCAVTGALKQGRAQTDSENRMFDLRQLGIEYSLEVHPDTLAGKMRTVKQGEEPNARITSQFSLTLSPSSPLRKQKVFAPGAIVVIALESIAADTEIVLESLAEDVIPAPQNLAQEIQQLSHPRGSRSTRSRQSGSNDLDSKSDGEAEVSDFEDEEEPQGYWRLPGDISTEGAQQRAPTTLPPVFGHAVGAANKALMAAITSAIANKAQRAIVEEKLKALEWTEENGLLPFSEFKHQIVFNGNLDSLSPDAQATVRMVLDEPKAILPTRASTRGQHVSEQGFDKRVSTFKTAYGKENFDASNLGDSDWLKEHTPEIVSVAYCKQLHAVVTDKQSRESELKTSGAQMMAMQPLSEFFNWNLQDNAWPPSKNCLKDLLSALRCILTGDALPLQLNSMKAAMEEKGENAGEGEEKETDKKKLSFHSDVIVESLARMYLDVLQYYEGQCASQLLRAMRWAQRGETLTNEMFSLFRFFVCSGIATTEQPRRRTKRQASHASAPAARQKLDSAPKQPQGIRLPRGGMPRLLQLRELSAKLEAEMAERYPRTQNAGELILFFFLCVFFVSVKPLI